VENINGWLHTSAFPFFRISKNLSWTGVWGLVIRRQSREISALAPGIARWLHFAYSPEARPVPIRRGELEPSLLQVVEKKRSRLRVAEEVYCRSREFVSEATTHDDHVHMVSTSKSSLSQALARKRDFRMLRFSA
jgi:hypothetical protein